MTITRTVREMHSGTKNSLSMDYGFSGNFYLRLREQGWAWWLTKTPCIYALGNSFVRGNFLLRGGDPSEKPEFITWKRFILPVTVRLRKCIYHHFCTDVHRLETVWQAGRLARKVCFTSVTLRGMEWNGLDQSVSQSVREMDKKRNLYVHLCSLPILQVIHKTSHQISISVER